MASEAQRVQARVFELDRHTRYRTLRGAHSSGLTCVAFLPTWRRGLAVATGSLDCTVATWDASTGSKLPVQIDLRQCTRTLDATDAGDGSSIGNMVNPPMAMSMAAIDGEALGRTDLCAVPDALRLQPLWISRHQGLMLKPAALRMCTSALRYIQK